MGACYKNYYHEFISCCYQPRQEKVGFLCEAVKALQVDDENPWILVYPVYRGKVYWSGWVGDQGLTCDWPVAELLYDRYGVKELPDLGQETGYLVVHVDQGHIACYGGEWPIDKPFPETTKAKTVSLTNYLKLVEWLTNRYKVQDEA